jgi:iron-sulfur cluster assembly accessory protein
MHLTPSAVEQLRAMLDQPEPKLIKVGVRNRGCSGLAYHLEYVDKPGAFDEAVEQDGVKVLIDSKALFSIIGSEMDWVEDKLNQRFVFNNPNISKWSSNCSIGNTANTSQRNRVDAASPSWSSCLDTCFRFRHLSYSSAWHWHCMELGVRIGWNPSA